MTGGAILGGHAPVVITGNNNIVFQDNTLQQRFGTFHLAHKGFVGLGRGGIAVYVIGHKHKAFGLKNVVEMENGLDIEMLGLGVDTKCQDFIAD